VRQGGRHTRAGSRWKPTQPGDSSITLGCCSPLWPWPTLLRIWSFVRSWRLSARSWPRASMRSSQSCLSRSPSAPRCCVPAPPHASSARPVRHCLTWQRPTAPRALTGSPSQAPRYRSYRTQRQRRAASRAQKPQLGEKQRAAAPIPPTVPWYAHAASLHICGLHFSDLGGGGREGHRWTGQCGTSSSRAGSSSRADWTIFALPLACTVSGVCVSYPLMSTMPNPVHLLGQQPQGVGSQLRAAFWRIPSTQRVCMV
jgi:hypothetical protein